MRRPCKDCNGNGYTECYAVCQVDREAEKVKIWCETCKGTSWTEVEESSWRSDWRLGSGKRLDNG